MTGASPAAPVRTLVVWCPDWPVVAAVRAGDAPGDMPVAIFRANRVIAASATARADGVRRAMRRRDAQSRCPEVEIVDDDPARDVRLFEPVAAMVDAFTPRVEIVRAGHLQFATRGPSRYFGGDAVLGSTIAEAVSSLDPVQPLDVRIGIADGPFTAALAARTASPGGVRVVEPGDTPAFLQRYPIDALVAVEGGRAVTRAARGGTKASAKATSKATSKASHPSEVHAMALLELVGLLHRLGVHTLADLAALPANDVLARFGPVGAHAWTIATGLDVRPLRPRSAPPELTVATECDPPLERVDTAAFVARGLADDLCARLATYGVACTCVLIEARVDDGTPEGRTVGRRWRHDGTGTSGGLTPQALGERVRWQLDGWLRGASAVGLAERLTGGITHLRLVPEEIVADTGRQLALWGGASAADERAARAFARVQALLGPDAVCMPVATGGRRPAELVALVPWGDARDIPTAASADRPWPGALPAPRPTIVHPLPIPTEVCGPGGTVLRVSRRGVLDEDPVSVVLDGRVANITAWAGPWPLEERWWDVQHARRQARLQLITETGRAVLAVCEGGTWWLEAAWE